MMDSMRSNNVGLVHSIPLSDFKQIEVDLNVLMKVLQTRISTSKENQRNLVKVLADYADTHDLCSQPLDVVGGGGGGKGDLDACEFANGEIETIYKVQLWQRLSYPDDVLRDTIQQQAESAHFCVYQQLFQFGYGRVGFLQTEKVLLEMANASLWVSELLRSLSLYATCLPVYLLPLLLRRYPGREVLRRVAPGLFVFDMIHLFPELFPFCTEHEGCAGFCFSYKLPLARYRRPYKLMGAVLTTSELSRSQMETLYEHLQPLDDSYPAKFADFERKARFLFEMDSSTGRYQLRRDNIKEYLENVQNSPPPPPTTTQQMGGSAPASASNGIATIATTTIGQPSPSLSGATALPLHSAHQSQQQAMMQQRSQQHAYAQQNTFTPFGGFGSSGAFGGFGGSTMYGGGGSAVGTQLPIVQQQQALHNQNNAIGSNRVTAAASYGLGAAPASNGGQPQQQYLGQAEMIIDIARKTFERKNTQMIAFTDLVQQVNERYQEISGQGVSTMDILDAMKEHRDLFAFGTGNTTVFLLTPLR